MEKVEITDDKCLRKRKMECTAQKEKKLKIYFFLGFKSLS